MQATYKPSEDRHYHLPAVEWLYPAIREPLRSLIPDDERYEQLHRDFEVVLAMLTRDTGGQTLAGKYMYGRGLEDDMLPDRTPTGRVAQQLEQQGVGWGPVRAGGFRVVDEDPVGATAALDDVREFARQHGFL